MELDDLMKLPKEEKEALINDFKKAAETGDVDSMLGLARCYYNAILVEKDFKESFKYYKMAAYKGSINAKYKLIYMYLNGEGIEKNLKEAEQLVLELERCNDGEILYNLGTVYEYGNLGSINLEKAFELYVKSATIGNDKGQIKVGNFYAEGKLFKADWNVAVKWWTKAAKQGNEIALQTLKDLIEAQTDRMINAGVTSETLESVKNIDVNKEKTDEKENTTKPANNTSKPIKNNSKPLKSDSKPVKNEEKAQETVKENSKLEFNFNYKKYNENKKKHLDELNENLIKAELGDSEAMYKVGDSYYQGLFGIHDKEKARYWFNKAVEAENYEGYVGLGRLEYFTINYKQDINKAKEYFTLAADKGSLLAKKWLARIELYYGDKEKGLKDLDEIAKVGCDAVNGDLAYYYIVDELDLDKAEFYVKQGISQNEFGINYLKALLHKERKEYDKYIENIALECELGKHDSELEVGLMYNGGEIIDKDNIKAFDWFNRAAKSGSKFACYALGLYYNIGFACMADDEKALYYYECAAKRGHVEALNYTGEFYFNGRGCEKDETKAFFCYTKAVECECVNAYRNLGYCYKNGIGCEVDNDKAFKYMKIGAEKGDKVAMYNLAIYYWNGIGCQVNKVESFNWYKKAADAGYVDSIYQVGCMLFNGEGCEVDTKEAFKMFEKAAESGYADSFYALGVCYSQGSGVEINAEKSHYHHEKAAELGVAKSMYYCALNYQNGNGVKQDNSKAVSYFISAMKNGCMTGFDKFIDFILEIGISKKFYSGILTDLEEVEHEHVWHLIGELCCKGEIVDQDYAKAYKYLTKACDKGYKEAVELRDMVFTKDGKVKNYIKTSNQTQEAFVDLSYDEMILAKELINKGYSLEKYTTSNALLTYKKKGFVDRYIQSIKCSTDRYNKKLEEGIERFNEYAVEYSNLDEHLKNEVGKLIAITGAGLNGREEYFNNLKKAFASESNNN